MPTAPIHEIADKPPDYDFVNFHKYRQEVRGSRTAGATDQTFLPECKLQKKDNLNYVLVC